MDQEPSRARILSAIRVERAAALPVGLPELVEESVAEGHRMLARLRDDWETGENRFDRPEEAFFVARDGDRVIGVCGLNRDPFAPDERCGRLRRLYVRRSLRRAGVATALVVAGLEHARGAFERVRIRTANPDAVAFYLARGFVPLQDEFATHELDLEGTPR